MPSLVVHPQWHRKIRSCVCVASMLTASWVSFQRGLPCPLVLILGMEISKISAEIYTWSIVNQEVIKIWKSRACNELEVKLRKCLFYKSLDRKPVENMEKWFCIILFACLDNELCCRVLVLLESVEPVSLFEGCMTKPVKKNDKPGIQ